MKVTTFIAIAGLLAVAAGLVWVRIAPDRAESIHVDPLVTGETSQRSVLIAPPQAPVFAATPEALFAAAEAHMQALPGTKRIAAGPEPLHASYTTRTPFLRFPDDLSLRVVPADGGSSIAVFSRARLAGYDWGVNRGRVEGLLRHLRETFPAAP